MEKYIYEELIRYDGDFKPSELDFYGEFSPLDAEERLEYLSKYSRMYKERYGENFASEKVITRCEAEELTKRLFPPPVRDFKAYRRKLTGKYIGWQLYTKRADIKDGVLILCDEHRFPLPCAKYEFDYEIKRISFSLNIGKEYKRVMQERLGPVATGRYVEFRRGCREVLNFIVTPDGTLSQKDGSEKPYHYSYPRLGEIRFGEWCDILIEFEDDECTVSYGGKSFRLNYSCKEIPDTIYMGGGMQPVDEWRFRVNECTDKNGNARDIFIEAEEMDSADEYIGEVSLPYGLATEKNRDCALVLKKNFSVKGDRRTYIETEALDPGGEILINGKLAAELDTFDPVTIDISDHVKRGENELEIIVFPRAPEVLYAWHRHFDYYNAWFALSVRIRECLAYIDEPLRVITNKAEENAVDFSVIFDTGALDSYNMTGYEISLSKLYPERGEARLIAEGELACALIKRDFKMPLDVWEIGRGKLYEVALRLYSGSELLLEKTVETGFRTIEQRDGAIYLNGRRIILKGALNMQFLPPYEEIPLNHLCPTTWQMTEQAESILRLGGNCIRMHQLGYGTADRRWTAVLDRLGVLSIWTTRLIDALENLKWCEKWHQRDAFIKQMKSVINSPSIIMWEGSNEAYSDLAVTDRMYDSFVDTVLSVDKTRLICPVSHLYYGGGIYAADRHDAYYNDAGTLNEANEPRISSHGWRDKQIVRSAHTYSLLLGYGEPWRNMTEQAWIWQDELFNSKEHAYIVSEFAVIGRQNPTTPEAREFINKDSYELGDEMTAFGCVFRDDEWEESQAYQALAAELAIRQLYKYGADGMLWCCLWGGANNASYLKPIIDFYGYKKQAFYVMAERFRNVFAFSDKPNVLVTDGYSFKPIVINMSAKDDIMLTLEIVNEHGKTEFKKEFRSTGEYFICPEIKVPKLVDGYYKIRYTLK